MTIEQYVAMEMELLDGERRVDEILTEELIGCDALPDSSELFEEEFEAYDGERGFHYEELSESEVEAMLLADDNGFSFTRADIEVMFGDVEGEPGIRHITFRRAA